jgi:DNA-binding XRE family transcriptional regulator
MSLQEIDVGGQPYVLVPASEFKLLQLDAEAAHLPPLPPRGTDGMYPAIEYSRASLARKIILDRIEAGLTQGELAKRARIRLSTLQRVESGKFTPTVASIDKIDRALKQAAKRNGRKRAK